MGRLKKLEVIDNRIIWCLMQLPFSVNLTRRCERAITWNSNTNTSVLTIDAISLQHYDAAFCPLQLFIVHSCTFNLVSVPLTTSEIKCSTLRSSENPGARHYIFPLFKNLTGRSTHLALMNSVLHQQRKLSRIEYHSPAQFFPSIS